ncbi:expressed unknown protein [Seminavis robusta]|uniref:C2 domain-containing protein n=1 Tax=Seminavis robusta TaxID=568900 RepID=A0A9N8EEU0_9STRA|nr:expressed unknown protein [Seminavis robusta]|eukprot:Sro989_g228450.1 n/a (160) ;mRNA; f:5131-5739
MTTLEIEEHIAILIEISSGKDLLIGDINSSDPYVVVSMGKHGIVHKTKYRKKTLNPEWTPSHNSTYVLSTPSYKLIDAGGLTFNVKDYDVASSDEDLGTIEVTTEELITEGNAVRVVERDITPPPEAAGKPAGKLTIRFRKATPEDEASLAKGEMKRFF